MSRNLKITLAYDGAEFHGWQVQPGLATVQGTLAECLKRLTGEDVLPQGSGRTDTGVHALAQVASVRLESPIPERNMVIALNDILPPSIRVNSVEAKADDFHARHSATAKTYRYRIFRADICPPFLARYVFHDPYPMNEEAVLRASEAVVGTHDFTSFAASDPDRASRIAEAARPARMTNPDSVRSATCAQFTPRNGCGLTTNWSTLSAETVSCTTWCAISWGHSFSSAKVR